MFFDELAQIAKQEKVYSVCDLGDTTDDRSFIYRATLETVLGGMQHTIDQLGKSSMLIKLTGNHEQLLKTGELAAEELFKPYFSRVGNGEFETNRCTIVYRSYTDDYEALNKDLVDVAKHLRKQGQSIVLLAHGDVRGAKYPSGEACAAGIEPDTLKLFDLALLGHIHNHQCLLSGKAWYVGSPFQQNFGEAGQRKWVAILDTEEMSVDFIEMRGFPEYRVVSYKDFKQLANPTEEHRYRVTLNSIDETTDFYSNPLSEVGEAILVYEDEKKVEAVSGDMVTDPRELLQRFVKHRPIQGLEENLDSEIVELALSFLTDD
jgi:DNA repair exonuclease SbcCD nuclease subunit